MKPLLNQADLAHELERIFLIHRQDLLASRDAFLAAGGDVEYFNPAFFDKLESGKIDPKDHDMHNITGIYFTFTYVFTDNHYDTAAPHIKPFVVIFNDIISALNNYRENVPESLKDEILYRNNKKMPLPIIPRDYYMAGISRKFEIRIHPQIREELEKVPGWTAAIKDKKSNPSLLMQR